MSKQLIDDLGGAKKVADALGVSHGSVRNWQLPSRAIPWKYRPAIARIAADRAVQLPDGFWAEIAA